jgi:hypothetical protein
MHIYRKTRHCLPVAIGWLVAATQCVLLAAGETQTQPGSYTARYWRLEKLVSNGEAVLRLDASTHYIAITGNGGWIQVWKCGKDFALEGPVYTSPRDRHSQYEVESLDVTSGGLMWLAAYNSHGPGEPGKELL